MLGRLDLIHQANMERHEIEYHGNPPMERNTAPCLLRHPGHKPGFKCKHPPTYLPVPEEEVGELALVDLDGVIPVLLPGLRLGQAARTHRRVRKHHRWNVRVVRLRQKGK